MNVSFRKAAVSACCTLAGALALLGSDMAAAATVVASSGPSAASFPPGRKLEDDARISLRKGDSVTVLDQRGTSVLRGPGRIPVSRRGAVAPNPAFALLTRKASTRTRTAATRTGADGEPMSPNLWYVDLARSGTKCVLDPAEVRLWRASDAAAARYLVVAPSGKTFPIAFRAGDMTADWPVSSAAIQHGAVYQVAEDGGKSMGMFRFVVLPDPPGDPEALATALIENRCDGQLQLLADSL